MKRLALFIVLLVSFCAMGAAAHFKLNQNVRIFHVVHVEDGLELFLRTPMAYLVAELTGPVGSDRLPEPAPYTSNKTENGALMHYVDQQALVADPLGLARIAANTLKVETGETSLTGSVLNLRAYPIGQEPGFATREEAEAAMAGGVTFPNGLEEVYVGDTVVDLHLSYGAGSVDAFSISSSADPGLPGQEETANLILDYNGNETRTYRQTGLLREPVEITGSASAAAATFIIEGIHHILFGLDHVLFVMCMIIGAQGLRSLLGRVTGFTVGHTVTLILGFFGVAPAGSWFIPTVELAIALSIIYAATTAVFRQPEQTEDNFRIMVVTTVIGLLHGFGFSFMLHQILKVDAPNVWQNLLAFNVGVEIGQLAIVLLVWPIVLALRAMPQQVWVGSRAAIALSATIVALFWTVQRTEALL